jgi:hypothetical protein
MASEEVVAENLLLLQVRFLQEALGIGGQMSAVKGSSEARQ